MEALLQMCNKYKQQGVFRVTQIETDGAFRYIESDLQVEPFGIKLVTCNMDKHVPRAKRCIRELKELIRCSRMIMKYKRIPQRFMIEVVKEVTKLVNSLPKENGVHMVQSPCHIVTGVPY